MGESSTYCLVENNVFRRLRHAMGIGTGANSNVYTFNYSREQYSTYKILGKEIPYGDSDICLHGRYPYANLYEHNIVEQIEADDTHGDNGPYNAFVRNRSYERNIDLYNAPYSTVLGSDSRSPGVERHGKTSFSLEAYGKSYLMGGKLPPYAGAPWISYFSGSFLYDPIGQGDNFSFLKDISYFYTSRPYFLSAEYTWPTVGPEYENPYLMELQGKYYRRISQTIPAEGRYRSGQETYISRPTRVMPGQSRNAVITE
jgi:hypothetical protein